MRLGGRAKEFVVLFVEDSGEARELYGGAIRDAGLRVDEAATVGRAMEIMPNLAPDLVLLDRDLPDGDGFEVARRLKSASATKHIPIVAFTSHGESADVRAAAAAGCDAFLTKPCAPSLLVAEIQRVLFLARKRQESS